ncbi:MAG: hypothetical protein JW995_00665 [Melioribacteraceae bacterium]|nr:hypothetical protein [Melioribacteraceae bacterium]
MNFFIKIKYTSTLALLFTILFLNSNSIHAEIIIKDFSVKAATLKMYSDIGNKVPLEAEVAQLSYFRNSLASADNRKIRIAHFGDSLIWGDVITSDIRNIFQQNYGGSGIGFVSICNDDMMIRRNVDHKFSDDWDWGSVFTKNSNRYPLYINGIASVPANGSWVSYKVSDNDLLFSEMTLLFSNTSGNAQVTIETENNSQVVSLSPVTKGLGTLKHGFNSPQSYVKLTFNNCGGAYIYGVNLDSGPGVYVDNFAMRGNSGVSLKTLDEGLLKDVNSEMNYSLVLLNFGINVVEAGKTDHTFYKKQMVKILKSYKKTFPNTSFVIVSAGDKAIKKGSRLVSDQFVPILVDAQKEIAEEAGVAYWNLYEAMGGRNAMVDWVKRGLGAKDYIHLSPDGGRIIAELLTEALLSGTN